MELRFDANQEIQTQAVQAVIGLSEAQACALLRLFDHLNLHAQGQAAQDRKGME